MWITQELNTRVVLYTTKVQNWIMEKCSLFLLLVPSPMSSVVIHNNQPANNTYKNSFMVTNECDDAVATKAFYFPWFLFSTRSQNRHYLLSNSSRMWTSTQFLSHPCADFTSSSCHLRVVLRDSTPTRWEIHLFFYSHLSSHANTSSPSWNFFSASSMMRSFGRLHEYVGTWIKALFDSFFMLKWRKPIKHVVNVNLLFFTSCHRSWQ